MTEENKDKELFLHLDDKIEKLKLTQEAKNNDITKEISQLLRAELDLDHKLDKLVTSQVSLQKRLDHTSETGHKTWEGTLRIESTIKDMNTQIVLATEKAISAEKKSEAVDRKFDKYITGCVLVLLASILLSVMAFLIKYKP